MNKVTYKINFVKPKEASQTCCSLEEKGVLDGDQARQFYNEEISPLNHVSKNTNHVSHVKILKKIKHQEHLKDIIDKDLFLAVQNNDSETVRAVIKQSPDKINVVDSYGWSLLMIACQANAVEVTKELLKHGIKTTVRDKAGNSACSLVIKNKNQELCNLLLDHQNRTDNEIRLQKRLLEHETKQAYECDICDGIYPDRDEHISSTIHNIPASKGRKFIASYKIPATNKGYQIMVKSGWDRNTGLGRDGTGKIYPIKAEPKKDKKGLGIKKHSVHVETQNSKIINKKILSRLHNDGKRKEINFRREFY